MKAITAKEWHLLICWFPPGHAGEAGDGAGDAGAGEAGAGEAGAGEAGDGAGEAGAGEVESSGRSGSEWSWGVYIAVTAVLLPCV